MTTSTNAALAVLALLAVTAHAADGMHHSATVLETMDSGGYTYMKVEEGGTTYWTASPHLEVAPGDTVRFIEQMRMTDFTSRTLDRTFDEILFISGVGGDGGGDGGGALPATHPPVAAPPVAAAVEPVARAEDGYTVAEVFARKDELKGETVKVRGRVVKVSTNIMGTNWVHLEDGTGDPGANHIVFRSATGQPEVGAVVTATGTLDTDRDFGFGYQYPVLVEDATFSH